MGVSKQTTGKLLATYMTLVPVPIHLCPPLLIPYKPDWHSAEVVAPRDVDYYISDRALGHLHRAVDLKQPPTAEERKFPSDAKEDSITACLRQKLEPLIPTSAEAANYSDVEHIFDCYQEELGYICTTHVVTNVPGARLTEEEIVTGTISAK